MAASTSAFTTEIAETLRSLSPPSFDPNNADRIGDPPEKNPSQRPQDLNGLSVESPTDPQKIAIR